MIKTLQLVILFLIPAITVSQAIEISSFSENPLEVNPIVGGNLTVSYKYSSESGSTGNHIYIGLEILDGNNNYKSTVTGMTLRNQPAGNNIENTVDFFVGSSNKLTEDLPTGHYYQVKANLYASGGWNLIAYADYSNTPALYLQDTSNTVLSSKVIAKGADVSWMTEMEADGFTWQDNTGTTMELLPLLKTYQLDAIRLRVWVNPNISGANGWCDIDDLVEKAKLADALGMDIMVTIHYSDYWADPGKQDKPAAWSSFSISQLETAIANHTTDVLAALNTEGITPKWVQIGNETNNGMLWPTGKATETGGFENYAKFLNAGSNAVKTYNSAIKTIIHIASGNDNNLFRWNIGGAIGKGLDMDNFDIIGMSLYPESNNWLSLVDATYNNMIDLKSRYSKDVMMVEVGMSSSNQQNAHQFLTYMIEKTKQADGLGVLYWEPIAHKNWKSYSKGAWDNDGSPSIVMDAFLDKSTLSTTKKKIKEIELSLYPNPSSKTVKIKLKRGVIEKLEVFDITGKFILSKTEKKVVQTINISNFKNGIYFLKVNDILTVKFIKK